MTSSFLIDTYWFSYGSFVLGDKTILTKKPQNTNNTNQKGVDSNNDKRTARFSEFKDRQMPIKSKRANLLNKLMKGTRENSAPPNKKKVGKGRKGPIDTAKKKRYDRDGYP